MIVNIGKRCDQPVTVKLSVCRANSYDGRIFNLNSSCLMLFFHATLNSRRVSNLYAFLTHIVADGQFTYMSTAGCSLIDYAIFPCNLFSIISNFIVHDFHTSSSHSAIQVSLKLHLISNDSEINNTVNPNIATSCSETVTWKGDRANDYRRLLYWNMHTVENLINRITQNEEDLNRGIVELSDKFLNCAKTVFGNNCNSRTVQNRDNHKLKSP